MKYAHKFDFSLSEVYIWHQTFYFTAGYRYLSEIGLKNMLNSAEPLPASGINWKQNLFVIWLSQFFAMVGFGCCMPFIPLLLKENLHIDDENVRGVYVSI